MSRLAGFLLVILGATALADTTEPPASPPKSEEATPDSTAKSNQFPLRVVKILPESEQVLLFDKNRGRHVLVEMGDSVGDYIVSGIGDDAVTLTGKDVPVEVMLSAPESRAAAKHHEKTRKDKDKAAADAEDVEVADAEVAPEDPYADTPAAKKAPADPYTSSDDDADEVAADDTARDFSNAIEDADDDKPVKVPSAPSVDRVDAPTMLSKTEVNLALNDFSVLAKSIEGSFTKTGLLIEKVAPGSVFAKAGLTVGDVVMGIDGRPLRTIDDAADLYARAGSMKDANVQIIRSGKPQTLRVVIK